MKYILILVFSIFILRIYSQDISSEKIDKTNFSKLSRLKAGDKLPENIISQILNFDSNSINLSDLKGKPFILDFWNKYCSICIATFPKVEKLQDSFKNKLTFITVTTDNLHDISKLKERSPIVKELKLPILYSDSLLSKVLFPGNSVPYYVWVDNEFRVRAITNAHEINTRNLTDFINDRTDSIEQRRDNLDDALVRELHNEKYSKSLIEIFDSKFQDNLVYFKGSKKKRNYSLLLESTSPGSLREFVLQNNPLFLKNQKDNVIGMRTYNKDVVHLFKMAYDYWDAAIEKVIIENNTNLENEPFYENFEEHEKWRIRNSYTYECVINDGEEKAMLKQLRNDLTSFFDITGVVTTQKVNCLIIKKNLLKFPKSRPENVKHKLLIEDTKGAQGIIIRNTPFNYFMHWLSYNLNTSNDPVVIDESGTDDYFVISEMNLKIKTVRDFKNLQKELLRYGITISLEERNLKTLILKKANLYD